MSAMPLAPAPPPQSPAFELQAFHNPQLARGGDLVRVILRVQAGADDHRSDEAAADPNRDRAEVLIIDVSGSMRRDLPAAKQAAAAAVSSLGDGMAFAVVAGNQQARAVWPADGQTLAVASGSERAAARAAIEQLTPGGHTAMSTWLRHARDLLDGHPARFRHVVLLTDGHNLGDRPMALTTAVDECRGVFRCDCRGLRDDWDVEQMRGVALALQGRCDIVPAASDLTTELPAMVASSRACTVPDLRLRLRSPKLARIVSCEQVHPEITLLHRPAHGTGGPAPDILLGAWAPGEPRDYRVTIAVPPRSDDATVRAVRAQLVTGDGTEVAKVDVTTSWTDNDEAAARIDLVVAHYDGQTDLANAVDEALQALERGDEPSAVEHLGRAVELSERHHNSDTRAILARIVDTSSGEPRLRPQSRPVDRKVLQTRGSRTVTIVLPDDSGGTSP